MVPKLRVLANVAAETGDLEGNVKACASGYFHTHYSTRGVKLDALSSFPPDSVIHHSCETAYQEAEALFAICGIPPTSSLCPAPVQPSSSATESSAPDKGFVAPSVDQWYQEQDRELQDSTWSGLDMACELEYEPVSAAAELDWLLPEEETRGLATAELDDRMEAYAAAGIALEIEEQAVM